MKLRGIAVAIAVLAMSGFLLLPAPMAAHHGSAISYDLENIWTTKATVTKFNYANPHPWLEFDRVNDKGQVEHWTAELITNPTFLLRAGWTKSRSLEALKPGTVVQLSLGTARAGGFNGCIRTIQNEKGEYIVNSGGLGDDAPQQPGAGRGGRGGRGQ
jgi:hypothetical protein